jgi:hypothetical protein
MKVVPRDKVPAGGKTMEDLRKLFESEPPPPGFGTVKLYPEVSVEEVTEAWNPALRDYEGGRNLELRSSGKGTKSIFTHIQLIDKTRVPPFRETNNLYIWESQIPYDMEVLDYVAHRADIAVDRVFIVDEGLNRT